MARLFTVAISEANNNATDHQIWLLNRISQRIVSLGTVSHSVSNNSYQETADLIELLVQVIAASTGNKRTYGVDYVGIRDSLKKLLAEYESNFSEAQVKSAQKKYAERQDHFEIELANIEESINSEDALDDWPAFHFFEKNNKRELIFRRKRMRELIESRNVNKKEDEC